MADGVPVTMDTTDTNSYQQLFCKLLDEWTAKDVKLKLLTEELEQQRVDMLTMEDQVIGLEDMVEQQGKEIEHQTAMHHKFKRKYVKKLDTVTSQKAEINDLARNVKLLTDKIIKFTSTIVDDGKVLIDDVQALEKIKVKTEKGDDGNTASGSNRESQVSLCRGANNNK